MAMQSARQYMSFEQYLLLVSNSDQRYEYWDGEVRLMADGSSNHATITLNFAVALDQALSDDALCHPSVADKLVRLTPTKTVNQMSLSPVITPIKGSLRSSRSLSSLLRYSHDQQI